MFISTSRAVNSDRVICFRRISETNCVAIFKLGAQLRHALCLHADAARITGFAIPLTEDDTDACEENEGLTSRTRNTSPCCKRWPPHRYTSCPAVIGSGSRDSRETARSVKRCAMSASTWIRRGPIARSDTTLPSCATSRSQITISGTSKSGAARGFCAASTSSETNPFGISSTGRAGRSASRGSRKALPLRPQSFKTA